MSKIDHDVDRELEALNAIRPDVHLARDGAHFRRIVAALDAQSEAETELRAAVTAARAAGDSWTIIAAALGTSRQNAQQRFGAPA